jgi:hypothetical protein
LAVVISRDCVAAATDTQIRELLPTFGSPGFVWGANYVPARRMTTYQVWWRFDATQIDREMGYAESIHLNALRMWLSYEFWLEDPVALQSRFDQLLELAKKHHLRLLISLYSNCGGVQPTEKNRKNEDPATGVETISPESALVEDSRRWSEAFSYLDWFMARYKNDSRLLAIELINEPGARARLFAHALLQRAAGGRGTVPLTIGCIGVADNPAYFSDGLDVMEAHPNFVSNAAAAESFCRGARLSIQQNNKPLWATEWQRVRESSLGWNPRQLPAPEERLPGYAPLCSILKKNNVQGFFWSLMLRPSFLKVHPRLRWFNGIFHEDGAVWSLEDARTIADDPHLQLTERHSLPDWTSGVHWREDE